jgi:hypothetical protein
LNPSRAADATDGNVFRVAGEGRPRRAVSAATLVMLTGFLLICVPASCSPPGTGTISAPTGKDKLKIASKIGTKAPTLKRAPRPKARPKPRGR